MNIEEILKDFDEIVAKLKMKIIYFETENKALRIRINELKKFVKEK